MFKNGIQTATWLAALPAALCFGACAAASEDEGTADDNPTTSGGSSSLGGETSTGGTTSSDDAGTGGTVDNGPVEALPINVTDLFAPSGFMGKEGAKNEIDGITMDPEGCPDRAEGAAGVCFSVVYQPQELDEASGAAWAGVFFQNPEENWGEEKGVRIEAGATKVVFTAWAKTETETVSFLVGGIGGVETTYGDTFRVETEFVLTTTPTTYELDLSNSTYDRVLGGFGWVVDVDSLDPVEFYIDDVRWVK